jgi:hypothetical protein
MKDDPIAVCPECAAPVIRLLYPVGIVFKGSGWYINDSRKADPADSSAKAAESKDGDAKTAEAPAGNGKETGGKEASGSKDSGDGADKKPAAAPSPAPTT